MNKMVVFISLLVSVVLLNLGITAKEQVDGLKNEDSQLQADILKVKEKIKNKESLTPQPAVAISTEYNIVMNQIRMLEGYSGTSMNVQLEGAMDAQDISSRYEDTEYQGVRGLKIRIVVDKFSKETDMGAVLDDIHLLQENTDFMASEISKDNNNLIVKGEIYGI